MIGKRVARAGQILRSARNLLRSAPSLLRELEQARRDLNLARSEFERESRRLDQARERIQKQREQLVQEGRRAEQREQRLKARRQKFKGVIRDYLLHKMPDASVCAEIGVHEGDFSRQILDSVKPYRLHLIDPWEHAEEYPNALFGGQAPSGQASLDERYEQVRDRFAGEIEAGQIEIHRDYSSSAAEAFKDSYFDWVYIDGNHLYEFVKQDLELYCPKVKPGGYIAGDDYGGRGWWDNGVQKAVDEFVEQRPELALEVINKQFIIRLP